MIYAFAKGALFFAALIAWRVTERAPSHRPIAVALTGALALDVLRAHVALPERLALAMELLGLGLGAWAALRAFRGRGWPALALWAPLEAWALLAPAPASWWGALPRVGLALAVIVEASAARRFYRERGPSSITQRTALALLAGDAAGLLFGGSPALLALQALAVGLFVAWLQAAWLANLTNQRNC